MVHKEVISLHIGQSGIQVGSAMWELFLIEHDISFDGCLNSPETDNCLASNSFFYLSNNGKCVPRTLLIDSEGDVTDEVKTGVFRQLFDPSNIIHGKDDSSNSYARGSYSLGRKYMLMSIDTIRRLVEKCDDLQGFMLTHSLAGGTGSGLTSVLLHFLNIDYLKKVKCQLSVYPGNRLSTSIVDPYNTALHIHSTMDTTNMAFFVDNGSLFQICRNLLNIYSPYFININRLIAVFLSSLTCSIRFDKSIPIHLTEIQTNLIPYPRIHFPIISHSPIIHLSAVPYRTNDLQLLLNEVFVKENQAIDINMASGKYMAIMLNGRGEMSLSELGHIIQKMKKKNPIKFVEWSPNGYKLRIDHQIPMTVPESEMGALKNSLTMLSNNTGIRSIWNEIGMKFDSLFKKRAYLHLYVDEGLEESELIESRLDIAMLWEEYEEISMTMSEIEKEIISKPSRTFKYSSGTSLKS